jgi:hypothetical protein
MIDVEMGLTPFSSRDETYRLPQSRPHTSMKLSNRSAGVTRMDHQREEVGSNRGLAAYSEDGTVRKAQDAEGRRLAGLVLGTSTEKCVRRPPLDRLRGEPTRTASGRGPRPQTLRSRHNDHSANCSNKACVRKSNPDIRLHCLITISIDDPTDILTVSTSHSRKTYRSQST